MGFTELVRAMGGAAGDYFLEMTKVGEAPLPTKRHCEPLCPEGARQ
jgi:hypothetical protein